MQSSSAVTLAVASEGEKPLPPPPAQSEESQPADTDAGDDDLSEIDNFPDPYEDGVLEDYSAFKVDDGADDDDEDDDEAPLVTLKLPKLTDPDKFAAALENAEDLSYEEHYFILQNAQQALVAWQDEFMRLDRYIAKHETGEDKDGVPVIRNPRALRYTGQSYQDRLEADVYGYEHNPHPSKIGTQDPIKQRISEGRASRALRDRINPTKKAAEGDDTTSPDDDDTPGISTPLDENFQIPDVEYSAAGRPLRMRNLSRQTSFSRDSTPVATFPSGKRIGRPPKKLRELQTINTTAESYGLSQATPPKRKGGRPSKKELEERAARAAAEAQLRAANEEDDDSQETRSNTAETVDRMTTRSATGHVDPASQYLGSRKRQNTSEFEEQPPKKKGGRPRKDAGDDTSDGEPEDRSQRLSKGQKASWAKDAGQRRLAQSIRMKEKWDRVRAADPNAKSLAGSKSKPEPPAILPPSLQTVIEPPKKNKGGRPRKIKPEEGAMSEASVDNGTPESTAGAKRKREDDGEPHETVFISSDMQPPVKKNKGGRPRKSQSAQTEPPPPPAPMASHMLILPISMVSTEAKKNKGGRPKKIREERADGDAIHDDPDVLLDAPGSQDSKRGRGGRPKKDILLGEDTMTPLAASPSHFESMTPSENTPSVILPPMNEYEFHVRTPTSAASASRPNSASKASAKKSKSEKMKAIMKARWENGEMNKVMEKKKANAAARRKAAGDAAAKRVKPTPGSASKPQRRRTVESVTSAASDVADGEPAPRMSSTGRKLSEYEEYQQLTSPVNSPLGRRGRRPAALRASASFSRLEETEDDDDVDKEFHMDGEDDLEEDDGGNDDDDDDVEDESSVHSGSAPVDSHVPPRGYPLDGREVMQQGVEESEDDSAANRQLGTEYDQFQAVTTPGSTVILGKRKRKPVVNLEEAMKIEAGAEDEYDEEYEEGDE